eukprot:TRINITY_DN1367_c0_g1_i1.p1 TRINITY_DN1367_c0_g1~~TRINITY_DN1367_c0_g1_i1.p1  ORF type:complete len:339 (+),score=51.92 TRINITY_DN1367_c0_g1_i1:154-1170(+)
MVDETKLFVARLPEDIQEDEMRMIFGTYGKVIDVQMLPGSQGPENLRSAFVGYDTVDAAKAAIQVLDNVYKFRVDASEPIRVSTARPRSKGGKDGGKGRDDDRNGRHDDYGKGGKGSLRKESYSDRSYDRGYDRGSVRGYDRGPDRGGDRGDWGGRGYDRGSTADRGYDRGYDRGPERGYDRGYDRGSDRGYDRYTPSSRGGSYEKGGAREQAPWNAGRGADRDYGRSERHAPPSKRLDSPKLYIGNLPNDITQEAVETVFSTYGRLEDVHVMNGRSKSGHSCAFVRYSSISEAETAVAAMATGYEIRPGEGHIVVKEAEAGKGKGKGKGKGDRYDPY